MLFLAFFTYIGSASAVKASLLFTGLRRGDRTQSPSLSVILSSLLFCRQKQQFCAMTTIHPLKLPVDTPVQAAPSELRQSGS